MTIQICCAGEALIDLVADGSDGADAYHPMLGGAPYNFSRALARQGVGVAYLNSFSQDDFGRELAMGLREAGVVLAQSAGIVAPSSLALVRTDTSGHPTYSFYRQGVADRQVDAATLNQLTSRYQDCTMVYAGCLALAAEDAPSYLPWLAEQKAVGKQIVIDANLRPQVMPDLKAYRDTVWSTLRMADIVKISDEDMLHLLGAKPEGQAYGPEDAQTFFLDLPARILVFTQGKWGASVWWRAQALGLVPSKGLSDTFQTAHAVDSAPLEIVDTVGAGDCFFAGFIASLLQHPDEVARALCRAIASASINVQRRGCQPATASEVDATMALASVRLSLEAKPNF